jgi:hypothetical protein
MKELPIVPDKVHYVFCHSCETLTEYNPETLPTFEMESDGEIHDYLNFTCQCGMQYALNPERLDKTKIGAVYQSLKALKNEYDECINELHKLSEENLSHERIMTLLYDQVKELTSIRALVKLNANSEAINLINKQITFISKQSGYDLEDDTSEELAELEHEKYGEIRERNVKLDKESIQKEKSKNKSE